MTISASPERALKARSAGKVSGEIAPIAGRETNYLRTLFDVAAAGIVVHANDGTIIDANAEAERLLGLSRDQMMDITPMDPRWKALDEKGVELPGDQHPAMTALRTGRRIDGAIMGIERGDGLRRWLQINCRVDVEPKGGGRIVIASFTDVTESRQREAELRANSDFIRTIADNIPGMVAYWSKDLRCRFANREHEIAFGRSGAKLEGIGLEEMLGAALFARGKEQFEAVLRGEDQKFERTDIGDDGSVTFRWVQYIAHRLAGEVQGFFVLSSDITALKSDEERRRLDDVALKSVSQGVFITGIDRRIVSVNSAFEAITGWREADVLGSNSDFLQGPLTDPRTVERMHEGLTAGLEFSGEIQNYRKDGRTFWNELTITPARNADGRLTHFIGICRDITERVSAREMLLEREMLARRKSEELEMVLGSMNQGISAFDGSSRLAVWNSQYATMFGMDLNAVRTGMTFLELLELQKSQGNFEGDPETLQKTILEQTAAGIDFGATVRMASGRVISSVHAPAPGGGWIGTHEDITAQHQQSHDLAETSRQLTTALSSMGKGLSLFDANGRLALCNDNYIRLYGLEASTLYGGMPFSDLMAARKSVGTFSGDPQQILTSQEQHFSRGEQYRLESVLDDGRVVAVVSSRTPEGGWVSTHEDVTKVRQQQSQLALQNIRFTAALNNMGHGLSMFDSEQRLVTANRAWMDIYRLPNELTVPGTPLSEIFAFREGNGTVPVEGKVAFEGIRQSLMAQNLPHEGIIELVDGRSIRFAHRVMHDGGWVATHEDITEQRRIEAQIEHDALHDALTGLPNRRHLDRVLAEREAACHVSGKGIALLHVDLDRFKQINDTLGHEAGDAMLVHAASVLRSNLRDADFVSRGGGDEFVVICSLEKGPKYLAGIASRMVKQMSEPVMYHGHECRFGVSIGIAHQTGARVNAKQLLVNADIALYEAKGNGRGRHEFFTPAMQSAVTSTKRLADEIQAGIERGEFVAHYQPQFNARTREISGVEALVRWHHPKRGILAPPQFLKIADELGLVGVIDRFVLEQTIENLRGWTSAGLRVPRASVNVSAKRLGDPQLIKSLKRLNFTPGTLSFELLESIYLDETDDLLSWNVEQIRDLGIAIEIDDFGSGHTSILSLLKLKPHKLKIDRQLVTPIVGSVAQTQLLRSIVEIGHSLGIGVTAEGVETLEHASIAEAAGCDDLQGYAFSRPLSAKEFAIFAAANQTKAA